MYMQELRKKKNFHIHALDFPLVFQYKTVKVSVQSLDVKSVIYFF